MLNICPAILGQNQHMSFQITINLINDANGKPSIMCPLARLVEHSELIVQTFWKLEIN